MKIGMRTPSWKKSSVHIPRVERDEINPDDPHPSQLPEFLETENMLLSLAPQYRPAEYPEPHLTLARLYVSRIVPTPVAIVNRLFNALSPEQLAQF